MSSSPVPTPTSEFLQQVYGKHFFFAQEALPERVEALMPLLPVARTLGLSTPLEEFLQRHTGETVSIDIDRPGGSWAPRLLSCCQPQDAETFSIDIIPRAYLDWLTASPSLLRFCDQPVYMGWLNQGLDVHFGRFHYLRAREALELLQPRPARPPDFADALRDYRAWLRRQEQPVPKTPQLAQLLDEAMEPSLEGFRAFLRPIAERDGAVFTWEDDWG
jgi:hypothetical protein